MIHEIIDGISVSLGEIFPDSEIYARGAEQGFRPRSFSITLVESPWETLRDEAISGNRRFNCDTSWCVYYFPEDPQDQIEIADTIDKMNLALTCIPCSDDSILFGRDMSAKVEDGALCYFVKYQFTAVQRPDSELMKTLKQKFRQRRLNNG